MIIYLDLNVFDRIQKIDQLDSSSQLVYQEIIKVLSKEDVLVPYSNAHLNDLKRGYDKDPTFIEEHLCILEKYTCNLLFCQYWGQTKVSVQHRSVKEFFQTLLDEERVTIEDMDKYVDTCENPFIKAGLNAKRIGLKLKPLPKAWKDIYKEDPIFSIMYPQSKTENNVWALTCDLNKWNNLIQKDYNLYKSFKSFQNKSIIKYKKYLKSVIKLPKVERPNYLTFDKMVDEIDHASEIRTKNPYYNKLVSVFYKFDVKGYKADKNFNNMVDDGLHTFYASFSDYFITLDHRCQYKAKKTYEKLKIDTKVLSPSEFVEEIKNSN